MLRGYLAIGRDVRKFTFAGTNLIILYDASGWQLVEPGVPKAERCPLCASRQPPALASICPEFGSPLIARHAARGEAGVARLSG